MSITLDDLFDTWREVELGAVEELREREWPEEELQTAVRIYENDTQTLVSIPFIGFIGVLIDKRNGRQIDLGGINVELQVWAYRLGVDLDGTNDLLIRSCTEPQRLKSLLSRICTRRHMLWRVLPNLGDLPVMLRGVRLHMALPELYQWLRDGALEVEIDPESDLRDVTTRATPANLKAVGVVLDDPEDLSALFGEFRSMVARPTGAHLLGRRLLEVSHYVFELDPDAWTDQWATYLEQTLPNLNQPLLEVGSLEELEHVVRLLPGARFALHMGSLGRNDEGAAVLARSPLLSSLTTLKLTHCSIQDAGVRELARSPYLSGLTHLTLRGHHMTVKGVKALVESPNLPALTSLNIKNGMRRIDPESRARGIGDEGAKAIARCCKLPSLTRLNLAHNSIGDEGAKALATSNRLGSLVFLKLSKNRIGEEGLRALAGFEASSSLELVVEGQRRR